MAKKSITRSIAGVLVGVLAIAAVAGSGTALYMGVKNNGWFEKQAEQETPVEDENEDLVLVTPTVSRGLKMTVMATSAEAASVSDTGATMVSGTTYTLSVTPDPVDAMDTYTWTSTDTTNITITPSSDTKSCVVTLKNAFGTQITVTCTSKVNSDVSAECAFDYVKKVSSVTVTAPTTIAFSSSAKTYTATATPTYGTGTITPDTFTITGGTLKNNLSGLTTQMSNYVATSSTTYAYYVRTATLKNYTFTGTTLSITDPYTAFVSGTTTEIQDGGTILSANVNLTEAYGTNRLTSMIATPTGLGGGTGTYPTVSQLQTAYNNSVTTKATNTSTDGTLTINYTYSYNGITLGTATATVGVSFNTSSMVVNASSLTPNQSGVIFY